MSTDYSDILDAAISGDDTPRRTKRGALKYQPVDTDWSLDRLGELQTFYEGTFKRPLPVTVKGQGSIHNKWGYDHRASADLSINPASEEGQALIAELQRRRVPFLAFDSAIPGVATGPHIHVGRPSSRTANKYGVGAQVKGRAGKPAAPADYSDVLDAAVGQSPAKPAQPATPPLDPLLHQLGRINDASDPGAPAGVGELRRIEGREQRQAADTGVGRLRQLDDPVVSTMTAQRKTVEADVRRQREAGPGAVMGSFGRGLTTGFRDPYGALSDLAAGRTETESVSREVDQRLQESYQAEERRRELLQQFTPEDAAALNEAVQRMRGQGPIARGLETGSQRVGSGILYKLGGLADILGAASGNFIAGRGPQRTELGDYLRRQAGRGELAIEQIEAELPPELSQQFADFAAHAVGALPEIFGATAVAGPVGGFAALGGLEAAGRKQPFAEVAKETAKGAALGAVFKGAGAVEVGGATRGFAARAADTARSSAAIGAGTYVTERAFGADDYQAARSAASNVLMHVGMRGADEIGRLTSAAERALKTPPTEPEPTVPLDLQERLTRSESAGQPVPPTEPPRRVASLSPAEKVSLAEAIERSQVPFEGPPAFGEGIAPRQPEVRPSGDPILDAARQVGLDYRIEVVKTPEGFTVQRESGEHIADVKTPAEAEAIIRRTIAQEPLPTVPPADASSRLDVPAEPAVGGVQAPTAPSRPRYSPQPIPEGVTPLNRWELYDVKTGEVVDYFRTEREAREQESVEYKARPATTYIPNEPLPNPTIFDRPQKHTKSTLADLMRERATAGPTERGLVGREGPVASPPSLPRDLAGAKPRYSYGTKQFELKFESDIDRAAYITAQTNRSKADQRYLDYARQATGMSEVEVRAHGRAVRATIKEMAKTGSGEELTVPTQRRKPRGEEGFIDITEIARGIRKLRDMVTERNERAVRYAYRLPTGREVGVNLTIDKQGVAYTQVRPLERQGREFALGKEKLDVGVETLLGLKRYLLQAHPEITEFKFRDREGELTTLTPVRRSTPEPVREVSVEQARTKLAERGLDLRESTDPIPTFSVVNAQSREVARFANRDRAIAAQNLAQYAGASRPKTVAPDFEQRQRLNSTEIAELTERGFDADSLAYYNRTDPIRLKRLYTQTVVRGQEASPADMQDIAGTSKPPKDQGGYIDLNEIREGLKAGKVRLEDALAQLKLRYPARTESELRPLLNRQHDPLIGLVRGDTVSGGSGKDLFRELEHTDIAGWISPDYHRWRYEPATERVYWSGEAAPRESQVAVENYLSRQGYKVTGYSDLAGWRMDVGRIKATEASPPVHHSATQPRTDTGQFAPGLPGGMEAARSQLRTEARKYSADYKRLDLHQARREGLDIVNDDVARNYFAQLHRMASEFLPKQAEAVDRAETLYNQGKFSQATMLAESVFRSLPDKVNEYSSADAAIQLTERGIPAKADWTKTLQEVRERLRRTGGLSGGGSTFYDVNKYPEGGRPDHAKIAYILEPVVEAIRTDAARLIAEGKLKAANYVAHVRKSVNEMLAREEFADWHPLNKSAALGILVDKLRGEGPPTAPPPAGPATEPAQPTQRSRSLPPTLERSQRDPGTNLTYDRLPNEVVNTRVEARLASEGADALETWYRSAPESADRTAAHRVLVDHYTAEAIRLADTAPQQAESAMQRARDLSSLEAERATTLGQAVQMYSNLLKYTAPGVLREISRLEAQGAKVTPEATRRLVESAKQAEATDKEVHRLERKLVEAEANEAPEPTEAAAQTGPGNAATRRATRRRTTTEPDTATEPGAPRPRRYRPRTDAPDTPAERVRRQLDEAAQRRRAQRLAIAAQLRAIEQQRTFAGYWKRSMNITRGLMVSAFSTAMRNLQSQALRFDIERLDDLVEHTMRRSVGLDSDFTYRNIWRNTARQFNLRQTAEAREILSAHEGEYHRMFNTYAGGVDVPIPTAARGAVERLFQTVERGVEIANFANRVQEFHVRSAEFLAELDLHLRREHNQTLEQYVRRNGIDAIPLELVERATNKALEVTFADMPGRDGAGGRLLNSLIELGNYIPPTVSPVAFPRFMFNNLKFLYQHSPAGMLDLARRGQNRPRVIARSLVGSSLLLLAYQFRQSDYAGEKWYELKLGDTTFDTRPFSPFSTYLFIAEAIRRARSGEKQFTLDEVAQSLGASVLGTGTGFALIEKLYNQISGGEWEKLQRTLKTEGGEWGRALLTPVRQVKDLIAAFDASQAVNRDTSESPFLGPIQESIPYADTNLPPAQLPTTATPIRQERPAAKAVTGWRVITPKTFLQRQLDELNFTSAEILPSTGNPTLDALQKRLMGPLMDELSAELERDTEFKSMSKKARAVFLRDAIEQIREEVRDAAAAEQPDLYEQHQEERKPRRTREFEQELNSPGLSRALQLGVPMSIPPMQPGEDDLAYRTRLLQLGRQRRTRLDSVVSQLGGLSPTRQRSRLHQAVYGG